MLKENAIEVPACSCPYCGEPIDRASSMNDKEMPSPGDVSLCLHCAGRLTFNEDLTVRPMTMEEFLALPQEVKHEIIRVTIALVATALTCPK